MNWAEFIRSHMAVLAGIDFFTVEVLTWRGLKTYYVLFFLNLESRRVTLAGMTRHPTEAWMFRWPAMRSTKRPAASATIATYSMSAMRNSGGIR